MDPGGVGEVGGEHPSEAHHVPTGGEAMEFLQCPPPLVLGAGVEDEPHLHAPRRSRQELFDKWRQEASPPDLQVGKLEDDAVLGLPEDVPEVLQVEPPVLGAHQEAGLAEMHGRSRPGGGGGPSDPLPVDILPFEGRGNERKVMLEDGREVRSKGNALDHGAPAPAAERHPILGREGACAPVLGGDEHGGAVHDAVLLVVVPVGPVALALDGRPCLPDPDPRLRQSVQYGGPPGTLAVREADGAALHQEPCGHTLPGGGCDDGGKVEAGDVVKGDGQVALGRRDRPGKGVPPLGGGDEAADVRFDGGRDPP